jgi:SAM-dependent MidA family methyltransferase
MPQAGRPGPGARPERADVAGRIRGAIRDHGPISFAEFMELALYAPGGFYDRPPIGRTGEGAHFVTSPHVHPLFGQLLGRGLREMWNELDRPVPFAIVEAGAGDGTLAGQLKAALADVPKRYVAVERSPGARAALGRLPGVQVAASLEALDQHLDGVVVANELLDNLPFARVRRDTSGRLVEVCVGLQGDRFVEAERPCWDPETLELAPVLAHGEEAAVPVGAVHFVERLARVLRRGYALLIDYAAPPPDRGGVAPTHGYRGHRVVADVLRDPGHTDVTAGVDLDRVAERARELGLRSLPPIRQSVALAELGFDGWLASERERQARAQDRREGREAVLAWSERNEASLLVDPSGLGGFRWLALRTRDLRWPPWLERAAARQAQDPKEG